MVSERVSVSKTPYSQERALLGESSNRRERVTIGQAPIKEKRVKKPKTSNVVQRANE